MPPRSPRIHPAVCLAALALISQSVTAAEPTQSLAEKRLGIIKGTTPGIVIIDFDKKPRAAASAPADTPANAATGTANAAASTTPGNLPQAGSKASAAAAPAPAAAPTGTGFLSALPPPSGRSLQSARRLDAPDQGIALPTARAASQPQAEPAKR